MLILGIETSCDDTGVAIYDDRKKSIIAHKVYSQSIIHKKYGGVVPELAARNHIDKIQSLIKLVIKKSKKSLNDIQAIAYTAGPGFSGCLLVGATISHALAYSLNIPIIPVNHMEGHLLFPMLQNKKLKYPFISLLISGGHTQLFAVHDFSKYKLLGETVDDAVGEAFDKIANLLGMQYPGGAKLEKLARKGYINKNFNFPRPMINHPNMNFSFSGLKTFTKNIIKKYKYNKQIYADIALAFESSIIDVLIKKCNIALKYTGFNKLVISGGVSANIHLRKKLYKMTKINKVKLFFPSIEFCTDNGAMIAYVGLMRFKKYSLKKSKDTLSIKVYPRWSLKDLSTL